jgi:hypothetical protein
MAAMVVRVEAVDLVQEEVAVVVAVVVVVQEIHCLVLHETVLVVLLELAVYGVVTAVMGPVMGLDSCWVAFPELEAKGVEALA